jgi:hypothetical protein
MRIDAGSGNVNDRRDAWWPRDNYGREMQDLAIRAAKP